jgi:lysophospholipase L1-like esterase
MNRALATVLLLFLAGPLPAQDSLVVDSMDDVALWKCEQKPDKITSAADPEPKEGQGALRLVIPGRIYAIAYRQPKADAAWNNYEGLAFRVKGDGSENWGEIRIQARNYDTAWVAAFPLKDAAWHEVRLAWGDLVPAGFSVPPMGSRDDFRPANITLVAFGKSWNFNTKHESPTIEFSVDDLRLVKGVTSSRARVDVAKLPPASEVVKRMKAGEAVTILALGDSITWGTDAGGNRNAYPAVLEGLLRKRFANEKIAVVNRAIGGSTTSKGRWWLGRDVKGVEADLVTIMFGFNEMARKVEDRDAASKAFIANLAAYAEEVASVMRKPPALVLLATIPGKDQHWETLDCFAEAVRAFGKEHPNVAVADVNGFFKSLGKEKSAPLMSGEAHPNASGQREMAKVVFEAITGEKPAE